MPEERETSVQLGILLPHEVFASLYDFSEGVLFYSLLTGPPGVAKLR